MPIAETIRYLRQRAGMSQEALAERSGVSKSYISQIESGRQSPASITIATISALASALGGKARADIVDADCDLYSILPRYVFCSCIDELLNELKDVTSILDPVDPQIESLVQSLSFDMHDTNGWIYYWLVSHSREVRYPFRGAGKVVEYYPLDSSNALYDYLLSDNARYFNYFNVQHGSAKTAEPSLCRIANKV